MTSSELCSSCNCHRPDRKYKRPDGTTVLHPYSVKIDGIEKNTRCDNPFHNEPPSELNPGEELWGTTLFKEMPRDKFFNFAKFYADVKAWLTRPDFQKCYSTYGQRCLYRWNGNMCAIGAIILDGDYLDTMENKLAGNLFMYTGFTRSIIARYWDAPSFPDVELPKEMFFLKKGLICPVGDADYGHVIRQIATVVAFMNLLQLVHDNCRGTPMPDLELFETHWKPFLNPAPIAP